MKTKYKTAENSDLLSELTLRFCDCKTNYENLLYTEEDTKEFYENLQKSIRDMQICADAISGTLKNIKKDADSVYEESDCKYKENKKRLIKLQLEKMEKDTGEKPFKYPF